MSTQAEKKPKAPKAKAVRSLWGGIFGGRHAGSEASDATAPLGTMTAVHVPSEAGSPEPRQVFDCFGVINMENATV